MHQSSSPYNSLEAQKSYSSKLVEMFLRQIGVFIGLGLLGFLVFVFLLWQLGMQPIHHSPMQVQIKLQILWGGQVQFFQILLCSSSV